MRCEAGCADCCRRELSITSVEAAAIEALFSTMSDAMRAEIRARADNAEPCAALDESGRCLVYTARPLVCRSHGVPIRFAPPAEARAKALPMLDVCPKNFEGASLADVDPACVLDQQTMSVMLGLIDTVYTQERGGARGERVALRDVLRRA
ncbi:MAG: YkgJ family cysteine cluster protein [Polyangiaceae bacterium]|nr:YkgJ family cysteine cluster protein [Polyangiaceae bacterium]